MKPILQALLVADHVYSDAYTGKKIVVGIFHSVKFKPRPLGQGDKPPGQGDKPGTTTIQVDAGGQKAGSPFCYISLTELHGERNFELRYVDLAENNSLFSSRFTIKSDDPIGTQEVVFPLPELPMVRAGTFAMELLCDDEPIGSYRIEVSEMGDEKPKDAP